MDKFTYKYCLSYWDEEIGRKVEEKGIVVAESYTEAVRRIEEYYGTYIMQFTNIEDFDFGPVLSDSLLNELGYTPI